MYKYDPKNCLVNLSNSILKRFGVETFHESIPEVDELLAKHKKIVLFLFDGMGKNVQEKHPDVTKDLKAHVFKEITSTFPPTTVAATNALLSGRYPNETGWLAWSQYFKQYGCNINVFIGTNSQTDEKVPDFNFYEIAHYESIFELINKKNKPNTATQLMEFPIGKEGHHNLDEGMAMVKKALDQVDEGFVYCYNTEPDHTCHIEGNESLTIKNILKEANDKVSQFAKDNPDYLVLVIADHGHVNVSGCVMEDHPDFVETLAAPMCFEGRSANFKVKKGQEKQFETLFKKYFGEYFELYTTQEVLDNEFYGPNPMNDFSRQFFFDYIAISIGEKYLCDTHEHDFFKGHHAGGTPEEMILNLHAFNQ